VLILDLGLIVRAPLRILELADLDSLIAFIAYALSLGFDPHRG